ncbi:MAG TPA: TadE family protein [Pyrinomonadaceae bacterium]|nr:TadE family protein [Pyrinomonadaceae bacterium]
MNRLRDAIKNFIRRENGTQMIEFALIFPVLILLFAGTVELGRLFYTYTTLAKATRAGARYLSTVQTVNTTSTDAAKRVVMCGNPTICGDANNPVILSNLTANKIVVTPPVAGGPQPQYVTVSITNYNYQFLVFNLNAMTGGNFNISLSPSTRMRFMR